MPNIVIRFITCDTVVDALIRMRTEGPVSHTELCLPDGTFLGAQYPDGVQIRPAGYCRRTLDLRYSLEVTEARYNAGMSFLRAQIGKPYNTVTVFGDLLNEGWTDPGSWDCSQLMAVFLMHCGFVPLNVQMGYTPRITPSMLHLSPVFVGSRVAVGQ